MSNRAERRASDPSVLARAAQHDADRERRARNAADREQRERRQAQAAQRAAAAASIIENVNRAGKK